MFRLQYGHDWYLIDCDYPSPAGWLAAGWCSLVRWFGWLVVVVILIAVMTQRKPSRPPNNCNKRHSHSTGTQLQILGQPPYHTCYLAQAQVHAPCLLPVATHYRALLSTCHLLLADTTYWLVGCWVKKLLP